MMRIRILIITCLLFTCETAFAQPSYPPPAGVYCSCGPTTGTGNGSVDPQVAVKPFVKGILVRVAWDKCEPTDNVYDWSLIDGQISAARNYGKNISLAIGSGGGIPQWVFTAGAQRLIPTMPVTNDTIAVPWDTIYTNRWIDFIAALGSRYQNDTTIRLVYITNSSTNGFEMQLPYASNPSLDSINYTDAKMIASWKTVMDAFNAAFPNHYLTNDFHPVNSSDAVADSLYAYALSAIGNRYGPNAWWWTQKNTTVYSSQYIIIQNSAAHNAFTGVQFAYSGTSDSASFGAGGMPAALQLAVAGQVCYWEIWNQDILNAAFDSLFNNATCAASTGIEDRQPMANDLRIYPNPAGGMLRIIFGGPFQEVVLRDISGRKMLSAQSNGQTEITIDLSGIENGLYFLQATTEGHACISRKIWVKR